MKLKTVKVRIVNQLHGQPKNEQLSEISIPEDSIQEMHGVLSRMWPDCSVYFTWWGKNLEDCFIYGMPVNQMIDDSMVEEGSMPLSEYTNKWYSYDSFSSLD